MVFWKKQEKNGKDPNQEAALWNNKACTLRERGKQQKAIVCYDKALKINPKLVEAWYGKGVALEILDKYQDALICFDKVLEIDIGYADAWYQKGVALEEIGRYQEAIEHFQNFIQFATPENVIIKFKSVCFGVTCLNEDIAKFNKEGRAKNLSNSANIKLWNEEIAAYKQAITINPAYVVAYNNMGVAYFNMGLLSEAIAAFKQAITLDCYYVEAYYHMGIVYHSQGLWNDVIEVYKKVMEEKRGSHLRRRREGRREGRILNIK